MGRLTYLFLLITLLWVMGGTVSAQVEAGEIAQQAQEAYAQGDYVQAMELYQTLVDAGVVDVAIYFNLGNAYYESGQLGGALVNYLEAHELLPRNDLINEQITRIRSERVDFFGEETDITTLIGTATNGIMTRTELENLVLLFWVSGFSGVALWLLRPVWRKRLRSPMLILGGMLFFMLVLFISRHYVSARHPLAVIVPSSVEIMSGPGEDYLALYRLFSATELRVISIEDTWVRFRLPNGREGWLPREVIVIIDG